MSLFFLQVIIDSAKIKDSLARAGQLVGQQKENLWDILQRGGPLMIPLAILLLIAIFFFIERIIAI
ncbi:MAG TPA: MotA/TolQ/ExbB proton channel family protein, partial [Puia sp.]|nr:MotA/TolQ/ExbB proton channel family protein [Puia sp.]